MYILDLQRNIVVTVGQRSIEYHQRAITRSTKVCQRFDRVGIVYGEHERFAYGRLFSRAPRIVPHRPELSTGLE